MTMIAAAAVNAKAINMSATPAPPLGVGSSSAVKLESFMGEIPEV
jgi:hypothetical protein